MDLYELIEESEKKNKLLLEVIDTINEEKGISSEIVDLTAEIKLRLVNDIKQQETLPLNHNGVTFKKGTIDDVMFNGNNVIIKWEYYSFLTQELLRNFKFSKPTCYFQKTGHKEYTIFILIKAVKGQLDFSHILQSVQHELEHMWEKFKRNNLPYKNMDLYNYGKQLMDTGEKYKVNVGMILYFSQKWEQRAFENGAYQYLMNHQSKSAPRENIKETELFQWTYAMKEATDMLKSINEPLQHPFLHSTLIILKDNFNIDFDKLIRIGTDAYKNGIRELGRVLMKVENDSQKNEMFTHYTLPIHINEDYQKKIIYKF